MNKLMFTHSFTFIFWTFSCFILLPTIHVIQFYSSCCLITATEKNKHTKKEKKLHIITHDFVHHSHHYPLYITARHTDVLVSLFRIINESGTYKELFLLFHQLSKCLVSNVCFFIFVRFIHSVSLVLSTLLSEYIILGICLWNKYF